VKTTANYVEIHLLFTLGYQLNTDREPYNKNTKKHVCENVAKR